jgi:hypothetical protein
LTTSGEREYIEMTMEAARDLWGEKDAEKMRQQIESTTSAVWRISQADPGPMTEPATKLRHRDRI